MTVEAVVLNWSGVLQPASGEMSPLEIKRRFGALLQTGVSAFRDDPQYLVEMAEQAAAVRYSKRLKVTKAEVRLENPDMTATEVIVEAEARLRDEGVEPPARAAKRRAA